MIDVIVDSMHHSRHWKHEVNEGITQNGRQLTQPSKDGKEGQWRARESRKHNVAGHEAKCGKLETKEAGIWEEEKAMTTKQNLMLHMCKPVPLDFQCNGQSLKIPA